MIAIIDYGAGNLFNISKAVAKLGAAYAVTGDPACIAAADGLILPGVGHAASAMENLRQSGLIPVIAGSVGAGRPFLGVCLGMQLLFEKSEEGPADCLGFLPGAVTRLPAGQKIPEMGWNNVRYVRPCRLFDGVPDCSDFYFIHSYCVRRSPAAVGMTDYGVDFVSAVEHQNVFGLQFHPEKSGRAGLRVVENFLREVAGHA